MKITLSFFAVLMFSAISFAKAQKVGVYACNAKMDTIYGISSSPNNILVDVKEDQSAVVTIYSKWKGTSTTENLTAIVNGTISQFFPKADSSISVLFNEGGIFINENVTVGDRYHGECKLL